PALNCCSCIASSFRARSIPGPLKINSVGTGPQKTPDYNVRLALPFDPCQAGGRIAVQRHGVRDRKRTLINRMSREDYLMLTPTLARGPRTLCALSAGLAIVALNASLAAAQTFGFATMQPGTLNHTSGSAVAKVLKEKAGLNVVVQPTAGESVMIPLVARGEAEFGIANIFEVEGAKAANPNLRLIGSLHALRGAFWVRKDTTMKTIADLKGKKVGMGYSAMRTLDPMIKAILATGGLTEKDVTPVLIPNVVRGADDFTSGAADMFFFAFGAPKVREVDATVGGIRALEISESGMAEARKLVPEGYLTQASPNPFFIGVEKPMGVYSWDN